MSEYRNPYSVPYASQILLYGAPIKEKALWPRFAGKQRRIQTPFASLASSFGMQKAQGTGDRGTRWGS